MKKIITLRKRQVRKDSFGIALHFTLVMVLIVLAAGRIGLIGQVADDLIFGFLLGAGKYLVYLIVLIGYICFLCRRRASVNNKKLWVHGAAILLLSLYSFSCVLLAVGVINHQGRSGLLRVNNFRFSFNYLLQRWVKTTFWGAAQLQRGGFWTFRGQWMSLPQTSSVVISLLVAVLSCGSVATAISATLLMIVGYVVWAGWRWHRRKKHRSVTNNNWQQFRPHFLNVQVFAQLKQLSLPPDVFPPRLKLVPVLAPALSNQVGAGWPASAPSTGVDPVRRWIKPRPARRPTAVVLEAQRTQLLNQLKVDPFGRRMPTAVQQAAPAPLTSKPVNPAGAPIDPVQLIQQQNDKFTLLKQLRQTPAVTPVPPPLTTTPAVPPPKRTPIPVVPSNRNLPSAWKKRHAINHLFKTFQVQAKVVHHVIGPTVTRFEVAVQTGAKVQSVINLEKDLKLILATAQLRIVYPVGGKPLIGLEIPNAQPTFFNLPAVLPEIKPTVATNDLLVALGRKIDGELVLMRLTKTPHLLIAGSTWSGKSVCINVIISCLIYQASPAQVRLLLIDPKHVELNFYEGLPHLLCPVIYDAVAANRALQVIIRKIHQRYAEFKRRRKRNLSEYNQDPTIPARLPFIVVVIDELADLITSLGRKFETSVQTIAQLARAAGVHLVLSTQRPSTDVITGVIKANIPSRIAFKVSNGVDSRTIIDQVGAEKLVGDGDMLYQTVGMGRPARAQGTFIDNPIITKLLVEAKTRYRLCYDPAFVAISTATPAPSSHKPTI